VYASLPLYNVVFAIELARNLKDRLRAVDAFLGLFFLPKWMTLKMNTSFSVDFISLTRVLALNRKNPVIAKEANWRPLFKLVINIYEAR